MPPKPKPKPKPKAPVSLLGTPTTTAQRATPTTQPSTSTPASTGGPNFAAAASSGPSTTAGALGISTADQGLPVPAGTAQWLGIPIDPGRTAGQAVEALYTLPKTKIAAIQTELRAGGILTGKYTEGVMDTATKDAFLTATSEAVASKVTIPQFLAETGAATTVAAVKSPSTATPAAPSLTDPAENAVALQNAYTAQGLGQPTAAEYQSFQNKIDSQEESKKATGVNTDPTSEATIFAEGQAAKKPQATTHAEASTDADITKAAAGFGVSLTAAQRSSIAEQVDANAKATGSPDVNLLNQLVAKQFRMPSDPSQLTGDAATVYSDLQALNQQYLIPESATTIANFVTKGIRDQSYAGSLADNTKAQYEQYLRQQAAVQLPWLAQSTDNFSNITPYAATASYRNQISSVLGIGDPDSVDLTSAKYSPLLKTDANGNPPTLGEINQQLLTNPQYGYDQSPNGIARGYSVGISLAKSLGVSLAGV